MERVNESKSGRKKEEKLRRKSSEYPYYEEEFDIYDTSSVLVWGGIVIANAEDREDEEDDNTEDREDEEDEFDDDEDDRR